MRGQEFDNVNGQKRYKRKYWTTLKKKSFMIQVIDMTEVDADMRN